MKTEPFGRVFEVFAHSITKHLSGTSGIPTHFNFSLASKFPFAE